MSESLMQKVLGPDWHKLPRVIQNHYDVSEHRGSCVEGLMTIDYPDLMMPVVWIIHRFGGLIVRRGNGVHTHVQKNSSRQSATLAKNDDLQRRQNRYVPFANGLLR